MSTLNFYFIEVSYVEITLLVYLVWNLFFSTTFAGRLLLFQVVSGTLCSFIFPLDLPLEDCTSIQSYSTLKIYDD
jgi:hypothetical protein